MRAWLFLLALGLSSCVVPDEQECGALVQVADERVLDPSNGQFWLNTEPAEKDCHALFEVVLSYVGDEALDPALPRPSVDVSANAVGTGGEQPGIIGIMDAWDVDEDPATGVRSWAAELDGGAKNVDAPAVSYGLVAVLQPGEAHLVSVYLSISYRLPASDGAERTVPAACR